MKVYMRTENEVKGELFTECTISEWPLVEKLLEEIDIFCGDDTFMGYTPKIVLDPGVEAYIEVVINNE